MTAVDGIDLGIRQSEVFGLLGPNGAGRSTTVEILQGNRSRDAGEALVLGADPAKGTRAWRSRIGIVRQDESAPAELTVGETVRCFAGYYPALRDPDQVIGPVGLEQKAGSRIKELSGGRRSRLDVALAVIGGPELLLLDEPTTQAFPRPRRPYPSHPRGLPPPNPRYGPERALSSNAGRAGVPEVGIRGQARSAHHFSPPTRPATSAVRAVPLQRRPWHFSPCGA
ncbi:ATP-binding cassette domain-containing protein [Streptomyces sp. NPDC000878]